MDDRFAAFITGLFLGALVVIVVLTGIAPRQLNEIIDRQEEQIQQLKKAVVSIPHSTLCGERGGQWSNDANGRFKCIKMLSDSSMTFVDYEVK